MSRTVESIEPLIREYVRIAPIMLEYEIRIAGSTVTRTGEGRTRPAVVHATHANRACHAVERDVEIIHDRLQRLRLSICIDEREECRHANDHDDREESDRYDHFDQSEPRSRFC